jgi:hypothetical protein
METDKRQTQTEADNVEENWLNIKQTILETTEKSIGYKRIKKKTSMRTWNEERKQIIVKKV